MKPKLRVHEEVIKLCYGKEIFKPKTTDDYYYEYLMLTEVLSKEFQSGAHYQMIIICRFRLQTLRFEQPKLKS